MRKLMFLALLVCGVALGAGFNLAQEGDAASADKDAEVGPDQESDATDNQESDDQDAMDSPAEEETEIEVDLTPSDDVVVNVRFFQQLISVNNARYKHAYRMAFILNRESVGASEESRLRLTFAQLRAILIKYGIIDSGWSDDPEELLTHEEAAYLFARGVSIDGGILWTLTQTKRYAHREAVDRKLFPDTNPRQYISGPQLLSSYRTCKDYALDRAAAR